MNIGVRIAPVISFLFVAITLTVSQELTSPKKETPQVRPFVVSDSGKTPYVDSLAVSRGLLPKFDVPEYVITGNEALDLPNAVRPFLEASPIPIDPIDRFRISSPRDRRDMLPDRRSAERQMIPTFGWNGRAFGSIGTFTTPLIGVWVGMREQNYRLGASGEYGRTKGWQRGTDRSDAGVGITGAYDLESPSQLFDNTELSANLSLSEKSYRFYGSSSPDLKRNRSMMDLAIHARNLSNTDIPFELGLQIGSLDVTDSIRMVTQRDVDFSVRTCFEAVALPWNVGFSVTNSSVSGNAFGSSSSFVFGGGTEFEVGPVRTRLSLRIVSAGGGRAERMTRVYPDIEAMIPVLPSHMISFSYKPDVQHRTLRSELTSRPFLSSNALIRPTDVNHDIRATVRSGWNRWLETRVILGFQSSHAVPIDVDSTRTGIWKLEYLPHATIVSLTGEAVAKFTSFDYYSATIIVQAPSAVGSIQRLPYLPKIEGGLHYIRRIGEHFMISPRLFWMASRTADASASLSLPEYVRLDMHVEYAFYAKMRCTLDIFNLLDRKNEWWDRYRERPLTVALGLDVRW
jgi:hypothetical protein